MTSAARNGQAPARGRCDDPAAFYEAYFPLVYAYLRRRTASEVVAEDLTAETFARILDALPGFEPGSDPERSTRVWVYRIASNVYKNRLRGRSREQDRVERWVRGWHPVVDGRGDMERSMLIGQAVAALDPADREVLGLRYWEGLTAPEIASVVGCSQRQVYTAVERCLRQLRRQLGAHASEETPHVG